jgi:TRAP-type C4-dicarboxylate transport system permease small subunit
MSDMQPDAVEPARIGGPLAWIATALATVGTIWIGLMMCLIVADVVGRNFLNSPITGVAEICGRSVVAIVFLQISAAILSGQLTRSDMLLRFFEARLPRLATSLEILFSLIGAIVFLLILYASWPPALESWRTGEYFGVRGVFTIPTLPFRGIIVLGCALAALSSVLIGIHHLRRIGRHEDLRGHGA